MAATCFGYKVAIIRLYISEAQKGTYLPVIFI